LRKLGMIGGVSWVSTAMYYEQINKGVSRKRGPLASAPLLIESLDFGRFSEMQQSGDWDGVGATLADSAKRLEGAGAEGLILCSNTAHKVHDRIAGAIGIPIIHIGDVTAAKLAKDGVKRAGLVGTRFTMGESFYRDRIEAHGIAVSVPDPGTAKEIDRIIFEELVRGHVSRVSGRTLKTCLTVMQQARQQAVILGCTELVLLVDPVANVLPVYDTTALHAQAAVAWILGEDVPGVNASEKATAEAAV
jgi:aspartate racemase